jgi:hypothetical protein
MKSKKYYKILPASPCNYGYNVGDIGVYVGDSDGWIEIKVPFRIKSNDSIMEGVAIKKSDLKESTYLEYVTQTGYVECTSNYGSASKFSEGGIYPIDKDGYTTYGDGLLYEFSAETTSNIYEPVLQGEYLQAKPSSRAGDGTSTTIKLDEPISGSWGIKITEENKRILEPYWSKKAPHCEITFRGWLLSDGGRDGTHLWYGCELLHEYKEINLYEFQTFVLGKSIYTTPQLIIHHIPKDNQLKHQEPVLLKRKNNKTKIKVC